MASDDDPRGEGPPIARKTAAFSSTECLPACATEARQRRLTTSQTRPAPSFRTRRSAHKPSPEMIPLAGRAPVKRCCSRPALNLINVGILSM